MSSVRQRSLSLYRGLLSELRRAAQQNKDAAMIMMPWKSVPVYSVIADEFRYNSNLVCSEHIDKKQGLAERYLTLLFNVRKGLELEKMYKGHGEKSIERSAAAVGLKLPSSNN